MIWSWTIENRQIIVVMWPHEKPEAHFTSHRLLLDKLFWKPIILSHGILRSWEYCQMLIWYALYLISLSISMEKPMTSQHHQQVIFDDLEEVFLPKSGFLYPSPWEEVEYVHLKDFLKNECVLYLKQSLTSPPPSKVIVAYCTSNHRLAIQSEW